MDIIDHIFFHLSDTLKSYKATFFPPQLCSIQLKHDENIFVESGSLGAR